MKSLKHYFQPGSDQKHSKKQPARMENSTQPASVEMQIGASPPTTATPYIRSGDGTPHFSASRNPSRPTSLYPVGDFRNSAMDDIMDIKCDVMVNWLYQQQLEAMWTAGGPGEGVVLKRSRGIFTSCPPELSSYNDDLFDAVKKLNVRVAITVNTRVIKLFLRRTDMAYIPLRDGLRLQILPNISYLPSCQKHHFAAFIHDTALLVVWDDDPRFVLSRARNIETQLMDMIWDNEDEKVEEKSMANKSQTVLVAEEVDGSSDKEALEDLAVAPRRLMLEQSIMCAGTLILLITAIGAGWREVSIEIAVDHNMIRLAFILIVPLQMWLALFFMQSIVGSLAQILGPVGQMNTNSKFYSGVKPVRIRSSTLPHVTIQCPVYKEGLHSVIDPTIKSVKAAISTYEMQGGTANIFVNDDGMQLLPEEESQARRDFYDEHNIGWVARPKHNSKPADGEKMFIRAGKFKKASNMNYALAVSARVEDKLAAIERVGSWTNDHETRAYRECLSQVIEEDAGRTWADGNVRVGDYILIIDSDTRVPADCFLDAVSEMEQSPQVGIIQFSSGVMNVTTSFFENGITFFTNLIYTAINFAVANGDVAPFVGHNAMLRWAAVQDVAYDSEDGTEKYWSEATVSEDFDMALRLQTAGYIIRFGAYFGDGFKEGVSLTVYDELARWEKYAYGCNELIFHPIRYWPTRGPFTKLFRNFIGSGMPIASKVSIMAYIGTYYAIGSAWILTLLNYFAIGWYNGFLDHYYIDSFKVFISIVVVFTALGNVALAIIRYRIGQRSLLGAFVENLKWVLMLAVFLGGISMHVSQALLSHMFGIDMTWGATSKEAENVSFFEEVPRLLKRFKWTFSFCILMAGAMAALGLAVPPLWRINLFIAVFPMANVLISHVLLPIALNPNLMLFTW